MELIWKLCNCEAILMSKINFSGERLSRKIHITTLSWVLPQCTKLGRNQSLDSAAQLLLEDKWLLGETTFFRESCLFPVGVHAWWSCTATELNSEAPLFPVENSCPEYFLESDFVSLIFHTNSLLFLLYSKVMSVEHCWEFTSPLYKHF